MYPIICIIILGKDISRVRTSENLSPLFHDEEKPKVSVFPQPIKINSKIIGEDNLSGT